MTINPIIICDVNKRCVTSTVASRDYESTTTITTTATTTATITFLIWQAGREQQAGDPFFCLRPRNGA